MTLLATLPIAIVLGAGLLTRAIARSRGDSERAIRALGISGAALALLLTFFAWNRGARGASGTLDSDPFSLYCSALLLGLLFIVLLFSKLGSVGVPRLLIHTVFLLLVVSTRDLLWTGAALTLLTMSLSNEVRATVGLAGFTFWTGAILLVSFGGGSDLAVIGASTSSLPLKLGIGLTLVGVSLAFAVLNARSWRLEGPLALRGYLSAGAWIASTAALIRVSAWLDVSFGAWSFIGGPLGAFALVVGSLGLLLSTRLARLGQWFVLAQAGFALVAIGLGVEAVPPLLLHLASGAIALVLSLLALEISSGEVNLEIDELAALPLGRFSALVVALAWLTFASLPPFPGFISKFPIFVSLAGVEKTGLLAVLVVSTMLVAVGCTRWMSRILRVESAADRRRPTFDEIAVAALALGFTLALGVFPQSAIEMASRAAAGVF